MAFYLFQASYTPAALKAMVDKPQDRETAARPLVEAEEAEKLIALVQKTMAAADGPSLKLSVPLVVEAKAADTWAAAH